MRKLRPRRTRIASSATALIAALALAACGGDSQEPTSAPTSADSQPESSESATAPTAGPIEATDDTGATLTLDEPATRVACLTMICVDALTEVGITPVAYRDALALDERYVGPDTDMLEITGGFGEENVEDIALATPDLVIGLAGAQDGLRDAVEEAAPLYLVDPASWEDSVEFLRLVGQLTGTEETAAEAADEFVDRMESVTAEKTEVTTLSMFGEPGSLGVDSVETPVGSLLAEISDYPWPAGNDPFATIAVEQIADVDPDVVFAQAFSASDDSEPLSERLSSDPIWRQISAAQNDRVVEVEASVWATGRGTISLGLVLDTATETLDLNSS